MELLHPGIYPIEVSSGPRAIEGVSTSTTAFLGKAELGPLDRPVLVTSLPEYFDVFGGYLADSYLTHAAQAFYDNGGKRLYVVRVANGEKTASVTVKDRQGAAADRVFFSATSPGKWGNKLEVQVEASVADPANLFKLNVKQEVVENGVVKFEVKETYDALSMDPALPNYVEKVVGSKSTRIRATVIAGDPATKGTSVSAANPAPVLPAGRRDFRINVNGDGFQSVVLAAADAVGTEAEIATAIQKAVRNLQPLRGSTDPNAYLLFGCSFSSTKLTLTSGVGNRGSSVVVRDATDEARNMAGLLKLGVTNGGVETGGSAALRPAEGTYKIGDDTVAGNVGAVVLGDDGGTPQDADYLAAFSRLDTTLDFSLLAVPGIGTKAVVEKGVGYCQNRKDCFFIGDTNSSDDTVAEGQSFISSLANKSSFGAIYFPWIRIVDPTGAEPAPIPAPPSGFMAGLYARTDSNTGVWKAPAGSDANLIGATALTKQFTDNEQDFLNPIGLNVIRQFPATGIICWGARTLATVSDPQYRYIQVRRTAIFLQQSLIRGLQWVVFRSNDEPLWADIRASINAFMQLLFTQGAFAGQSPREAYFVKCDGTTTRQEHIDAGIVNIEVGFRPLKPAEFVVIRFSQITKQG